MKLTDFIRKELVLPNLTARRKKDVIRELAEQIATQENVDAAAVEQTLLEREKLGSTAVEHGIAIPHGKLDAVPRLIGCVARSRKGVDFESEDGAPSHLIFVLLAPRASTGDHLKALARISRLLKGPSTRSRLMAAESAEEMYAILAEEDAAGAR